MRSPGAPTPHPPSTLHHPPSTPQESSPPTRTTYLDCVNNVACVGHCHPHVVAAVSSQTASLSTNSRFLHPTLVSASRRLLATFGTPALSVVFWCNSGSEANDLALRLARAHTGKRGVVCVDGAYHGHTSEVIGISPYKFATHGGSGRPAWVRVAPAPDVHSGLHRGRVDDPELGRAYAAHVAELARELNADAAAAAADAAAWAAWKRGAPPRLPPLVSIEGGCPSSSPHSARSTVASDADSSSSRDGASTPSPEGVSVVGGESAREAPTPPLSDGCGAFICESVLSCGGQIVPPAGFLAASYAAVRRAGGVCIADEVQTGMGRCGTHWWAWQAVGGRRQQRLAVCPAGTPRQPSLPDASRYTALREAMRRLPGARTKTCMAPTSPQVWAVGLSHGPYLSHDHP